MKIKFKNSLILLISFCILLLFPVTSFAEDLQNEEALEEVLDEDNLEEDLLEVPVDKDGNPLTDADLKIYNIVKNALVYAPSTFSPTTTENLTDYSDVYIKNKQTVFENGDVYDIYRFYFKENSEERYTTSYKIEGNTITVRYINPETKEWVNTSNLSNLMFNTLFIDTDTNSYVVSVPGVYKNDFTDNTLTIMIEEEQLVTIEKADGYFNLKMSFPKNTDYIGEFWAISSNGRLVDWSTKVSFDQLLSHDLALERRWSYDGYYYSTPYNYIPGGENVLYRHPSNYTGASWARYVQNNLAKNMGYIMTQTCMQNQNELGYWETGPKSLWLEEDFNIGAGFYDTRFNTDFALSLLYAYQNYNNQEFLGAAVKYAEYFLDFAKENSYLVEGGGILVQDYAWHKGEYEKTHTSLNHQLAEINFLYRIYLITKEQSYLDLADEMLLGIENTRNKWVLEDNNLNYALMYDKTTNVMVDYPYLTYNDLYETKNILATYFNKTNDTIEFLMAAKKQYMDNNNITGYLGYSAS